MILFVFIPPIMLFIETILKTIVEDFFFKKMQRIILSSKIILSIIDSIMLLFIKQLLILGIKTTGMTG